MVEVRSPGNSAAELAAKRDTYLKDGALEVWICEEDGRMRFHGRDRAMDRSALVPGFPTRVPTR